MIGFRNGREEGASLGILGLCCDWIVHELDFRSWFRSMFVWGYLGLLWALIRLGLLNRDARLKSMVPINKALILYLQPVRYIKSFYLNPVSSIKFFFSLEKDNGEGLWINDPKY